ncbi:peptide-methionine (R)-S-oxide reductase MsrB [Silvibacterium acidisoli]|uniref:peptide-methionine (R)-S-oxide reductase MsrB n=1 Tax=Acidobacteriaceae bacterium ZG23-2 TaxID=2883246 RepID=UPI00406BF47D
MNPEKQTRRTFLILTGATAAAVLLRPHYGLQPVEAKSGSPKEVKVVQFSPDGQRGETVTLPVVSKSDSEWKQQLSPAAFDVTRRAATERPYSGEYWDMHRKGIYRCICCETALFSSDTKFESGTGWPSFWQPIAKENVRESIDVTLGMQRTAVACKLCDAHLGHVFDDGPRPTGLRYCMNSLSLKFAPSAS